LKLNLDGAGAPVERRFSLVDHFLVGLPDGIWRPLGFLGPDEKEIAVKAIATILMLFFSLSFSMAQAADITLSVGDRITVGGSTISCGQSNAQCSYIAGNVYCGYGCEYLAGNVYCSSEPNGKCQYIAGDVYCGVDCRYMAGGVHCVGGGLAKPAVPSR
jgi:hypothetical protein